jgi:hypothetical protein
MAEAFYVGAYWGPRGEPVEDCARRLSIFLSALAEVDPLLASWFKTGGSRKVALQRQIDPTADSLRELLLSGQARRDDASRSVMAELGYSADMWNGQSVQVGLRVRCGSPVAVPGVASNTLALQLPVAEGDALALYRRQVALAVTRSVVMSWAPSWCTWTSHRLRKAQEPQPGEVVVGWATYVANQDGVLVDQLPSGVAAESLDGGLLLVADGDADSASEATVSTVRTALGRALRPAS